MILNKKMILKLMNLKKRMKSKSMRLIKKIAKK